VIVGVRRSSKEAVSSLARVALNLAMRIIEGQKNGNRDSEVLLSVKALPSELAQLPLLAEQDQQAKANIERRKEEPKNLSTGAILYTVCSFETMKNMPMLISRYQASHLGIHPVRDPSTAQGLLFYLLHQHRSPTPLHLEDKRLA
jgi:hypothetical protein